MISSAMLAAEDPLQSDTPRNEVSILFMPYLCTHEHACACTNTYRHTVFNYVIPHLYRNTFMCFSISMPKNTVYLKVLVYFFFLVLFNVCVRGDD
jgi:hypothetical protein